MDLDFEVDENPEKKRLGQIKGLCMGFLGKALGLYKRARRGDSSGYYVGMAVAYINIFRQLAPFAGIRESSYDPVVRDLIKKITPLMRDAEEASKKVIVEHRRDPEGVKLERDKLEQKTVATAEPEKESTEKEEIIEKVTRYLSGPTLNYSKAEARKRAELTYRPYRDIESLIADACRARI